MKKIVLAMAVLALAVPAWAGVTITATDEGGGVVAISYTSDANVSAFGLDITVSDGNIIAISDYNVGESNSVSKGYGIFPGGIVIVGGSVTDYNTPVADVNAPGALGGLGTSGITIEMGALYEDGNQPPLSGLLCRVTVDTDCTLTVAGNSARGDVVLETAGPAVTNLPVTTSVALAPACRDLLTPTEQALYDRYVAAGKDPTSWCWQYQCRGDADNAEEPLLFVGNLRVYNADLTILAASWKKAPEGGADPDADFNHAEEPLLFVGNLSVYNADLTILATSWKATSASLADCPTYIP